MTVPAARPYEEAKLESFRRDLAYAAAYLSSVLADGDSEEIVVALRQVGTAFGMAAL